MDDLQASRVLAAAGRALQIAILDETDSTNARMKTWARGGEEQLFARRALPAVLIADRQTSGRGRLNRSFYSPGGTGLYMTLALPRPGEDAPPLTVAAAVTVAEALEARGFAPAVKWVNDIFVHHKKVCGILAELVENIVIVGIGVNILPAAGGFPPDIQAIAGALGAPVRRDDLAGDIAGRLIGWSEKLNDPALIAAYEKRMPLIGREIAYTQNNQQKTAIVRGVDRLGGLIVGENDILRAGEISLGSGNITI